MGYYIHGCYIPRGLTLRLGRQGWKKPVANTEVLTTELVNTSRTNNEVMTTGTVMTSRCNTGVLITGLLKPAGTNTHVLNSKPIGD